MKPNESARCLQKALDEKGIFLENPKASDVVAVVLEFYSSERAKGCKIEEDGDMLLYQWGVFDWGTGDQFEFDLTRQFISKNWRGEKMTQMHITLRYPITPEIEELASGDRWCSNPSEIESFREFIQNSEAFSCVNDLKPSSVNIDFEEV